MKSKFLIATSIFTLSMLYGCLDEVTEAPDMSGFACSTEPLDDDSGVKIICGGDSVGVVLNGKNGKDGKNGEDAAIIISKVVIEVDANGNRYIVFTLKGAGGNGEDIEVRTQIMDGIS
jgi:hypothetical protein